MLNVVALTGRLTRDPELKTTQDGTSVVSFSIAVDRNYKSGNEYKADFINIVAWRQTAEFISRYFHKGSMIAIQGSLQQRQYYDKNNNTRTVYEVVADSVSFCSNKNEQNGNYSSRQNNSSNQRNNYQPIRNEPVNPPQSVFDDWNAEGDEDLPF